MRIQGKKVWIAGQFMAAQLEIAAGKNIGNHPL